MNTAFLILAVLLAITGLTVCLAGLFADRSCGRRRCPRCWHGMEGTPGTICPECGRDAGSEERLFKTRHSWRRVAIGILLAILANESRLAPQVRERGWVGAVPSTAAALLSPLEVLDWIGEPDAPLIFPTMVYLRDDFLERCRDDLAWDWQARVFAVLASATGRLAGGEARILRSYDLQDVYDVMVPSLERVIQAGSAAQPFVERQSRHPRTRDACAARVAQYLMSTVAPESWADNGGDAAACWRVGPCMIVIAPAATHDEVSRLLEVMHRVHPTFDTVIEFSCK